MITRDQLQTHLHEFLQCGRFRDYAPNGLQVEGRAEIRRILTAVTASQAAIAAAIGRRMRFWCITATFGKAKRRKSSA